MSGAGIDPLARAEVHLARAMRLVEGLRRGDLGADEGVPLTVRTISMATANLVEAQTHVLAQAEAMLDGADAALAAARTTLTGGEG